MRIASIQHNATPHAAVQSRDGLITLHELNKHWKTEFPETLDDILQQELLSKIKDRVRKGFPKRVVSVPNSKAKWAPLVARPRNLWGVGLNFQAHAKDLGAANALPYPSGFHRPSSCLAAHGATLRIPTDIGVITGEAEIGILVGKPLWRANLKQARSAVAGYTALLDLTAEELLRKDVRYIGRSKAYPDSVALGPFLVTPDEWEPRKETRIATTWNGAAAREGRVEGMAWDPWRLLADFSHVFPWFPGDVLQTGTPGAVPLQHGGELGAEVAGLPALRCKIAKPL